MSDSTTQLDQLASSQSGKEIRINETHDAMSPSALGARRASTTTGLTWGFYGGKILVNGVSTAIANGTVTLTASNTNYVSLSPAGVVQVATTRHAANAPLYAVVAAAASVTSYTDERTPEALRRITRGLASQALTTANVTLSQAQALCDTLVITGALTAIRDLVVPLVRRQWTVRHTGSGFDARVIGASGTGVTVGIGKTCIVECDGTNVNRVTADV
jgi:hypothetical protein